MQIENASSKPCFLNLEIHNCLQNACAESPREVAGQKLGRCVSRGMSVTGKDLIPEGLAQS